MNNEGVYSTWDACSNNYHKVDLSFKIIWYFDGKKIGYNCETALWKTHSLPNLYYYTYEESPYYFLSFLILISTLIFMGSPRVRLLQQQGMGVPLMCLLPYSAVVLAGWYNWYSDVLLSINRSFFVTCLILINFRE